MISKVIVHGPTRAVALSRLDRALAGTQVGGTVTNLAFLGALTRHAGFAAGDVDTGLIGRDIDALVAAPAPEPRHVAAAAMAVLGLAGDQAEQGFTLWAPLHRAITLGWQGEELAVDVQVEGRNRQLWQVGADQVVAERHDGRWRIGGRAMPDVSVAGGVATVFDGYGLPFDIIDPLERDSSAGGDTNVVLAPMPGLVKAVFAAAGQAVQEGDRLAILEAMKMEHSLLAARDGVVAEVLVEAGAALVRLVEEEA